MIMQSKRSRLNGAQKQRYIHTDVMAIKSHVFLLVQDDAQGIM